MATINDVASRAGVSKSTVSHTLSGKRPVADETRKRVLEAIEELGYVPNNIAQSLTIKRTNTIGLLFPIKELIYSHSAAVEFIIGAEKELVKNDYRLLLHTSDYEDQESLIEVVLSGFVDGVIVMDVRLEDDRLQLLEERGLPFVTIGRRRANNESLDYVDIDAEAAIYNGVNHLIGLGHQKIAFMGLLPWDFGFTYRSLLGYKKALREAGIKYRDALVSACVNSQKRPAGPLKN